MIKTNDNGTVQIESVFTEEQWPILKSVLDFCYGDVMINQDFLIDSYWVEVGRAHGLMVTIDLIMDGNQFVCSDMNEATEIFKFIRSVLTSVNNRLDKAVSTDPIDIADLICAQVDVKNMIWVIDQLF